MRLTKHNGRKNKSGVYRVKHNDRNFDLDKAEHIDKEKTKDNVYWHCYGEEKLTFEEIITIYTYIERADHHGGDGEVSDRCVQDGTFSNLSKRLNEIKNG